MAEKTTQDLIKLECDSAMHPLGIFSKLDAIEAVMVRIDDKLKRIRYDGPKNIKEDTVLGLIGYLILLRVVQHAAI